MNTIKIHINNESEMINLGTLLTFHAYPNLVLALTGDLGAGKTTFTKGIGKALEIQRVINSPTFTIMKIYDAVKKVNGIEKLYHLDVYRLNDSSSDFELEEYFNFNGLTIIEWADIIDDLLPADHWHMTINDIGNNQRLVTIDFCDSTDINKIIDDLKGAKYEIIY